MSIYGNPVMMGGSGGGGGVPTSGLQYVMNRAGTVAQRLICTLAGRSFYKAYDDPAFAAWIELENGYAFPLLVSTTQDGAKYKQSYNSDICNPMGSVTYNGVLYYYSGYDYLISASTSSAGFASKLGIYSGDDWQVRAATDLLDLVFGV